MRLDAYGKNGYKTVGDIATLTPDTYFVESIDEAYRRTFAQSK